MTDDARKCALVTGGAQGIGRAIARRLLQDGWAVVIADLDREGISTWFASARRRWGSGAARRGAAE